MKNRWPTAYAIAAASDAASFAFGFTVIPQIIIDLLTAALLFGALGFRPALLIPLFTETIPGLSAFPAWVLVLGAMKIMGKEEPAQLEMGRSMDIPKTLTRAEASEVAKTLKAGGQKLVFTNGVFDILHVGHLRYLQQARGLGDKLMIGLNSDASVKRLKGEQRPILPQAERAELLAGLACVDYVVFFDEDDPRELIKAVVPDVLVKGGDWPVDKILGADTVRAAGGVVKSLPFVEGRSTTSIVQDIAKKYPADFKE